MGWFSDWFWEDVPASGSRAATGSVEVFGFTMIFREAQPKNLDVNRDLLMTSTVLIFNSIGNLLPIKFRGLHKKTADPPEADTTTRHQKVMIRCCRLCRFVCFHMSHTYT